ncbi:YceD family protein [Actinomycetospora atypica]|uniref:YceD family protein n=1 Tax=Actinomycetospora atypica TaxID=1290095 RepID=A0ABV9YHH3_9PSEU
MTAKPQKSTVDPTNPWIVDTARELSRRPGTMKLWVRDIPAPDDFGLEVIGVPEGEPIHLDLRLESVMEGVLASGTVTCDVVGECSRCLSPVTDHLEVDLTELYAYPHSTTTETTDAEDVARIVDEKIDLEPAARDAVLLELPNAPLCREDCPGVPSPDEQAWAFVPAGSTHERIDPRWAALQERFAGGSTEN